MRIAVTGANGFLGTGIVQELINHGVEVIAVDYSCERVGFASSTVTGSIFDLENPFEELGFPDCVLHLAWKNGFQHNALSHIEDLPKHISFIRRLLESPLKKIAIMGTMHEVGYYEGGIRADSPCNPQNFYGIAKNALRQACFALAKQSDICMLWLRGYYIVDNSPFGDSIFSKIARAEKENQTHFPFTSGKNLYDFLSYDAFCRQVAESVINQSQSGIINISSGVPERLSERVEQYIKDNHFNIKLDYGAFPDRPYDSPAVWGAQEAMASSIPEG